MIITNSKKPAGDTLIEVIFAFAILGTIIGFAFTGVVQGRKSAVAAQQRSQALLIAQAQASAMVSYRSALPWDEAGGIPSFKGGQTNGSAKLELVSSGKVYCVLSTSQSAPTPSGYTTWALLEQNSPNNTTLCNNLANPLTVSDPANNKVIRVIFEGFGSGDPNGTCSVVAVCDAIRAEIGVFWTDPYGQLSSVKNFVILTKSE